MITKEMTVTSGLKYDANVDGAAAQTIADMFSTAPTSDNTRGTCPNRLMDAIGRAFAPPRGGELIYLWL